MTMQAKRLRDTRIDVFRALALLTIYINHVPGNVFEKLTHREFGFSDSAEAFVLISGLAVALAYGAKFVEGNRLILSLKLLRRSATLYIAQIMTTVATLAIFSATALYMKRPELLDKINISTMIKQPAEGFVGLITLGHQLGYNNILSLYLVLMILTPLLLLLANISLRIMLIISGAVWFLSGYFHIAPPNYPTAGVWFLNPLSWQFLYAIGIAAMIHVKRGGQIGDNPVLMSLAVIYLTASLLWLRLPHPHIDISLGLPAVITGFDKTYLSATRLLHVLALAYLIAGTPLLSGLARTSASHPLAILGKHSLAVFIAGTILAMIAQAIRYVHSASIAFDVLLIMAGVMAQFALAYYLEFLPYLGRKATSVPPSEASAVPVAGVGDKVLVDCKFCAVQAEGAVRSPGQ